MPDSDPANPEHVQIELKRLENEMRTKEVEAGIRTARIDAWKMLGVAFIGTALVGVLGAVLNHQHQTTQLAIERAKFESEDKLARREQERHYLTSFVNDALHDKIQRRIDFAHYVSSVATDGEIRTSWQEYHGELEILLDGTRQDLLDEIESLQTKVAALETASDDEVAKAAASVAFAQQRVQQLREIVGLSEQNPAPAIEQVATIEYHPTKISIFSKWMEVPCEIAVPPLGEGIEKPCDLVRAGHGKAGTQYLFVSPVDVGVYRSNPDQLRVSLDGNLLETGKIPESESEIYSNKIFSLGDHFLPSGNLSYGAWLDILTTYSE